MRTVRSDLFWVIAGAIAATTGCVLDTAEPEHAGPQVLWVSPATGTANVSRAPRFVVALDRPVGPRGFGPESVAIWSGERRFAVSLTVDPTTRSFTVVPRSILPPSVGYRLELQGFEDLDGRSAELTEVRFVTGTSTLATPPSSASWADASPVLANCARCHGGDDPVLGMDLSSAEGVRSTAIGIPAREVRTGDPVGVGGGLLGLNRIEPGSPERSLVIWKLTGDEHVPGDPMPPDEALDEASTQILVAWIRSGAPTE